MPAAIKSAIFTLVTVAGAQVGQRREMFGRLALIESPSAGARTGIADLNGLVEICRLGAGVLAKYFSSSQDWLGVMGGLHQTARNINE